MLWTAGSSSDKKGGVRSGALRPPLRARRDTPDACGAISAPSAKAGRNRTFISTVRASRKRRPAVGGKGPSRARWLPSAQTRHHPFRRAARPPVGATEEAPPGNHRPSPKGRALIRGARGRPEGQPRTPRKARLEAEASSHPTIDPPGGKTDRRRAAQLTKEPTPPQRPIPLQVQQYPERVSPYLVSESALRSFRMSSIIIRLIARLQDRKRFCIKFLVDQLM